MNEIFPHVILYVSLTLSDNLQYCLLVGTFQMKQVSGDDLVHRSIETAFQCGYRLIGKIKTVMCSCYPFHSQDLFSNSLFCLLYNSHDVSWENLMLVLDLVLKYTMTLKHCGPFKCLVLRWTGIGASDLMIKNLDADAVVEV